MKPDVARSREKLRHVRFVSAGPSRLHPLRDLLAAFLERAKALVQGVLNRFSRCLGVTILSRRPLLSSAVTCGVSDEH
jgi:hypothetical protein